MCVAGSNLVRARAQDKSAKQKGATFLVQGKNATYGPFVGPLRVTVVLGDAAEAVAGQCGAHTFLSECTTSGSAIKCGQR
jgi:hypothetical protein